MNDDKIISLLGGYDSFHKIAVTGKILPKHLNSLIDIYKNEIKSDCPAIDSFCKTFGQSFLSENQQFIKDYIILKLNDIDSRIQTKVSNNLFDPRF